jgi:hypothetical protein
LPPERSGRTERRCRIVPETTSLPPYLWRCFISDGAISPPPIEDFAWALKAGEMLPPPISDFAGFFVRWTWTLKAGEMLPVPISDLAGSFGFGFDGFSLI